MVRVRLAEAPSSDAERLIAAASGRSDAVQWLLDDIAPIVHGFLWARVGGDRQIAEDLLQETIVAAVGSAANYRGESSVSTWMCGIARNLLARHWESERRNEVTRSRLRAVADEQPPPDEIEELAKREEVARALGRLPALQRQVLTLKYLDGLAVQEIAVQVGRSRVQVQSLLQRGREGLRRELGTDYD